MKVTPPRVCSIIILFISVWVLYIMEICFGGGAGFLRKWEILSLEQIHLVINKKWIAGESNPAPCMFNHCPLLICMSVVYYGDIFVGGAGFLRKWEILPLEQIHLVIDKWIADESNPPPWILHICMSVVYLVFCGFFCKWEMLPLEQISYPHVFPFYG